MMIVGLTGGIGSGKTAVSNRFGELGVPIIDADVISHELSQSGARGYNAIIAFFGTDILLPNGELDRGKLRGIVFDDLQKKQSLEAILHPLIRQEMRTRAEKLSENYCIFVIPLLVESNQQEVVDRILVVDAHDQRRIDWIKNRSGIDDLEIQRIFDAQASREQRLQIADDVIDNNGSLEELKQQVDVMHHRYLTLTENLISINTSTRK